MNSLKTIAVVALLASPSSVYAATFPIKGGGTFSAELVTGGRDLVDMTKSVVLPSGAGWTVAAPTLPNVDWGIDYGIDRGPDGNLDPCRAACSPFYDGVIGVPGGGGATGWETTPFFTFFDGVNDFEGDTPKQPAVLTFAAPQTSFSLLWGSPDMENVMSFLLGGTIVTSFLGSQLETLQTGVIGGPGRGSVFLTLSDLVFDTVQFATGPQKGSFEFSNISATPRPESITPPTPIPLPPAIFALIAALGALVVASRRRKNVSV
jgi:hypothetical protein